MAHIESTVGVYCRVSSKDQKTVSQEADLRRWLAGNGHSPDRVHWFIDHVSGRTLARPAFEELQSAVFHGEIRTLVCTRLDRVARNLRDGINTLADWADRGIRVVVTEQQLDINGTVGRLVSAVLFSVAELEWELRRDRQRSGIDAAKLRGIYKGRKAGTTKAKPERARALREQGFQMGEIAKALGCSVRTAWRYLE